MKKKIHEMKFYILYNYKSELEATISKLFPFIDDNTTSIIARNNFSIRVYQRNLYQIQWEKLGTLTPQYGQHLGQSSETIFFLMEILMSNLKPHLIREIQKNPNWYLRYWNVKFLISEINPKSFSL